MARILSVRRKPARAKLLLPDSPYQQLYQEMQLTLEPMAYLPFDLSIDFEIRQAAKAGIVASPSSLLQPQPGGVANGGGSRKGSLTSVGTPRVMSVSPEPPSPPQVSARDSIIMNTPSI